MSKKEYQIQCWGIDCDNESSGVLDQERYELIPTNKSWEKIGKHWYCEDCLEKLSKIKCACKNCKKTSLALPNEYDILIPLNEKWEDVEGDWYCPGCSDYTLDHYNEVICNCQIHKLELKEIKTDSIRLQTVYKDKYGNLWWYDLNDPRSGLPRPVCEEDEE